MTVAWAARSRHASCPSVWPGYFLVSGQRVHLHARQQPTGVAALVKYGLQEYMLLRVT